MPSNTPSTPDKEIDDFWPIEERAIRAELESMKREATTMFHNDHDDGDTAIYGLISDFVKWTITRDQARETAALICELKMVDPIASHKLAATVEDRIVQLSQKTNGGEDDE